MAIFDRLFRRRPSDPYWDRFINGPIADPLNEPSESYRSAPAGDVFPVRTELPEPARLASDLAEFAVFLGATSIGVASTDPVHLRPADDAGESPGVLAEALPFAFISVVAAGADPDKAHGIGGQHARRQSAMVSHSVASYIRELGYQAMVCAVDARAVAAAAGLPRAPRTFVGDAVLTDIPVALGAPEV